MPETDYVITDIDFEWEGSIKLTDLRSFLQGWFLKRKYDLVEKEYSLTETNNVDRLKIRWWAFKKIDDYTRFNIDVTFIGSNLKPVNGKRDNFVKGYLYINAEGYIDRDYEGNLDKNFLLNFLREVIDTYFKKTQFDKFHEELKSDVLEFREAVKKFMNAPSK